MSTGLRGDLAARVPAVSGSEAAADRDLVADLGDRIALIVHHDARVVLVDGRPAMRPDDDDRRAVGRLDRDARFLVGDELSGEQRVHAGQLARRRLGRWNRDEHRLTI